jgi:hypothetical protein
VRSRWRADTSASTTPSAAEKGEPLGLEALPPYAIYVILTPSPGG